MTQEFDCELLISSVFYFQLYISPSLCKRLHKTESEVNEVEGSGNWEIKHAARLNTRACSLDRDEWSGFWNMSPDVYYMEVRSFLHIQATYMLILHFAACLCYSQEVYRLMERIYPTFIHISQWVTSILNIQALKSCCQYLRCSQFCGHSAFSCAGHSFLDRIPCSFCYSMILNYLVNLSFEKAKI